MNTLAKARLGAVAMVIVIIGLTVLEFPAPVGFETRPQDNVSLVWLAFFLLIVLSDIAAIVMICKRPFLGGIFGIAAGTLNILQIIADQLHLMQPEAAPIGYLMLEDAVGVASLALIYFSWRIIKHNTHS